MQQIAPWIFALTMALACTCGDDNDSAVLDDDDSMAGDDDEHPAIGDDDGSGNDATDDDAIDDDADGGDDTTGDDAMDDDAADGDVAPAPSPEPPTGEPLTGIEFGDGWTDARALPDPVSLSGWEDSAFISADGTTLYFGYTQYDFLAMTEGRLEATGPERPGQQGPAFDIYEARIKNGAWAVTASTANDSDPNQMEAAIGVNHDQSLMAFVRFDTGGDIYLTRRESGAWGAPSAWSTPEKLPAPVNTACSEDNPHLSPDGTTLYFDSNRADPAASDCIDESDGSQHRTIYSTHFDGTNWSMPAALRGAVNETAVRWQVFVSEDAGDLYWTGADDDCPDSCIYRARLQPDGSYGERMIVAKPSGFGAPAGSVAVMGEISITADGRYFYFVYATRTPEGKIDLSLGVARQR